MPPITPYFIFLRSISRSENLLKIQQKAHGLASRPPAFYADIYRASYVFAVSALDAYIRTLVISRSISYIKNIPFPLPQSLRNKLKELFTQDILIDAARTADLSSRVELALRDHFGYLSFQGVDKILNAMQLIGYSDIFKDVARSAAMNEVVLKGKLADITKRRHSISHCGDYDICQTPPNELPINKRNAVECINFIKKIASEIDKVVSK
jgi:hypothetical protein